MPPDNTRASHEVRHLDQEAAAASIWEWDLTTGAFFMSAQSAWLYGVKPKSNNVRAMIRLDIASMLEHYHPDDLRRARATRLEAMTTCADYDCEFRIRGPRNGPAWRWLHAYGRFVVDEVTNQPCRIVGLTMDVTERRAVEEALRVSEERLGLALDSGDDGLWDWNVANDDIWISDRWLNNLGFTNEKFSGCNFWTDAVHPEDRAVVASALDNNIRGASNAIECEHRIVRGDGSEIWTLTRGRVVERAPDGRALRLVGTQINISRRKAAELRMQHMALHDGLTGLPNRELFRQRLEQATQRAGSRRGFAVLACDLDRFKSVNDTLGHAAGDHLLRIVADRMTSVMRHGDTVARLGGDEFGVVLTNLPDRHLAYKTAERLIAAVSVPIELGGGVVEVGLSVGLALLGSQKVSPDESFKRADIALYEAKAGGRGIVAEFRSEAGVRVRTQANLGFEMKDALRRGDFWLAYQPVVDVGSGAITSFEALLRWRHPLQGNVQPSEFIPLAEESGLIIPLGAWVLHEACREAANWPDEIRVAVNVSALQLRRDGFEQTVVSALAGSGIRADRLKLEVTESVLLRDADGVLNRLRRLRSLGVRIALDDFGTGFSSLSYLRRFPFDKIKIDRGFVREIADPDAAAIIRAVVGIGERLGMGIVAEGVETEEQLELVKREGCTEVQGYLYARPMPKIDARRYIALHNKNHSAL